MGAIPVATIGVATRWLVPLTTVVERVTALTGGIDLIHCNGSRDPLGSNRDRHANLDAGEIPFDLIVDVVRAADAPTVVETPRDGQANDIAMLRDALGQN